MKRILVFAALLCICSKQTYAQHGITVTNHNTRCGVSLSFHAHDAGMYTTCASLNAGPATLGASSSMSFSDVTDLNCPSGGLTWATCATASSGGTWDFVVASAYPGNSFYAGNGSCSTDSLSGKDCNGRPASMSISWGYDASGNVVVDIY